MNSNNRLRTSWSPRRRTCTSKALQPKRYHLGVLLAAAGFLTGCGGGTSPEELGALQGTVLLDGQPVPQATILATLQTTDTRSRFSRQVPVVNGKFVYEKNEGLKAGSYDLSVRPAELDAEQVVSEAQSQNKTLLTKRAQLETAARVFGAKRVEVKLGSKAEVEISLTSQASQ